ncbi:trypsin-like serine protease [Corynebacterium lubricantis]|uniref:trypsin-like serine protease n=1 Tax=Corynebacterium lubricantis TaxID=541095 RepID=UPI0003670808|nr:trypsin-like serine protease [Corynebacterium lubricantis]
MSVTPSSDSDSNDSGLATWSALIVVVSFAVAAVAWLGFSEYGGELGAQANSNPESNVGAAAPPEPGSQTDLHTNAASVLTPVSAPWAPGTLIQSTDHYPQPGEMFSAQSCTVAFSFTGEDGRSYAVTAGHCGKEGDLVWPTNAMYAWDYASEAGHYIYSGMYTELAAGNEMGTDIGIIEITDPNREMEVVGQPIETGLILNSDPAAEVCKTGGTTGYTCGAFTQSNRTQVVMADSGDEVRTHGDIAQVCAAKGDSGGPVFNEVNGRSAIIGVVSGTEAGTAVEDCSTDAGQNMLMSFSTTAQALEVIDQVVPDVAWNEQGW